MKMLKVMIFLILLCSSGFSQNLQRNNQIKLGTYNTANDSHNNRFHYEELTLDSNRTFQYRARLSEFVRIEKSGFWRIDNDTLILNERNPKYKEIMTVVEKSDGSLAKGKVFFEVKNYDGSNFTYEISASLNDTTIVLKNNEGRSSLPLSSVEEFYLSNALYSYPEYIVKDRLSNFFLIKVAPNRSFNNEKWLIENDRIRPRNLNGQFASYYLSK